MDDHIIKNFIYFIIIIGILLYFLYFFNYKDLLTNLSTTEHLVNLYKPNKVFYHDNKIYLIDSQQLLDEENPKIFDNFEQFQKYILDLEDKHLIKLPLDKKDIQHGINNIENIKNIQHGINNIKNIKNKDVSKINIYNYENNKTCNLKNSLCNFENELNIKEETPTYYSPNYLYKEERDEISKLKDKQLTLDITNIEIKELVTNDSKNIAEIEVLNNLLIKKKILEEDIFILNSDDDQRINKLIDNNKLQKFKKDKCHIKYINDTKCNEIDTIMKMDKDGSLNKKCYIEAGNSDICKKYNNYRWNNDLLKNFCIKDKKDYGMNECLIGEYFKDNLLNFE